MAPLTSNNITSASFASASSKSLSKSKIVPKNTVKGVSISPSSIIYMLLDNGLTTHGTFEVPPLVSIPATITPIKANGDGHSNMNSDENGDPVVKVGSTKIDIDADACGDSTQMWS